MDNDNGNLLLLSNPRFVDNRLSEDLQFLHRTHIVSLESGLLNICFHQLKCFMSLFAQWFYVKKTACHFSQLAGWWPHSKYVCKALALLAINAWWIPLALLAIKCLVNTFAKLWLCWPYMPGEYLCKALALLAINVWWIPTTRSTSARLFVGWTNMLTQCFGFHVLALAKPDACATHCLSTLSLYSIVWRGLQCFAGHAPGEALAKLWLCWSYMPVYTPLHSGKSYMRWHHFTVVNRIWYGPLHSG